MYRNMRELKSKLPVFFTKEYMEGLDEKLESDLIDGCFITSSRMKPSKNYPFKGRRYFWVKKLKKLDYEIDGEIPVIISTMGMFRHRSEAFESIGVR